MRKPLIGLSELDKFNLNEVVERDFYSIQVNGMHNWVMPDFLE